MWKIVQDGRTRKLSYRKDDRARGLIHGSLENFRESLSTPTATFPKLFNGLLFRLIISMCVQNLKFVVFPIPEIMGVLKKVGQSLDMPMLLFMGFCSLCTRQTASRSNDQPLL